MIEITTTKDHLIDYAGIDKNTFFGITPYNKTTTKQTTEKEYPHTITPIITRQIKSKYIFNDYLKKAHKTYPSNPHITTFYDLSDTLTKTLHKEIRTFNHHELNFSFSKINYEQNGLRAIIKEISKLNTEIQKLQYEISPSEQQTLTLSTQRQLTKLCKNENAIIKELTEILKNLYKLLTPLKDNQDYLVMKQIKYCIHTLQQSTKNNENQNLIPITRTEDNPNIFDTLKTKTDSELIWNFPPFMHPHNTKKELTILSPKITKEIIELELIKRNTTKLLTNGKKHYADWCYKWAKKLINGTENIPHKLISKSGKITEYKITVSSFDKIKNWHDRTTNEMTIKEIKGKMIRYYNQKHNSP